MTQLFIVLCRDHKDAFALRASTREAHLNYLKAAGASLFLAGPMLDKDEKPVGSMLIIEVENFAEAQAFAASRPLRTGRPVCGSRYTAIPRRYRRLAQQEFRKLVTALIGAAARFIWLCR